MRWCSQEQVQRCLAVLRRASVGLEQPQHPADVFLSLTAQHSHLLFGEAGDCINIVGAAAEKEVEGNVCAEVGGGRDGDGVEEGVMASG
jgi:hypothetical protein